MLPKVKRALLNLRDENERDAKRQRTGNYRPTSPGIPSTPVSPVPKAVVLLPTKQYSVEIEGLGQMTYKDGWFRQDGRPRTDLGLNDGRFITNAKVIIRDSEGNQMFSVGGGGSNQVISLQMNKNNEGRTVTVTLVQDSGNLVYRFPAPLLEMQVGRNETVNVYGLRSVTITAREGGHVVHSGIGYVVVQGKVQSVSSHGAGSIRVNGNVDEGLSLGGVTKVVINGDVRGDIRANGVCFLHVFGRHLGTGKVQKAWLAKVRISEEDWGRGEEDNNESKSSVSTEEAKVKENASTKDDKKGQAVQDKKIETKNEAKDDKKEQAAQDKKIETKKEAKDEEKTDYDDWEQIKMDVFSDDEDDLDFYS